jgi:hypothetical protein
MLIIEVWDHDTFGKVKKKTFAVFFKFIIHWLHDGIGVIIVIP